MDERRKGRGKRLEEEERGRMEVQTAETREGMSHPDRLQCPGRGQGKYAYLVLVPPPHSSLYRCEHMGHFFQIALPIPIPSLFFTYLSALFF